MGVKWVWRPGKGPADMTAVVAAGNAGLAAVLHRWDNLHPPSYGGIAVSDRGYTIGANPWKIVSTKTNPNSQAPYAVSGPLVNYWIGSAEYRTYLPAWNALGYWKEYSDFSDIASEVFIGATGVAVGGGIASTLLGGGASAAAGAGAVDTGTTATGTAVATSTAVETTAGGGLTAGGIASGAAAAVKAASGALGLVQTGKSLLAGLAGHDPAARAAVGDVQGPAIQNTSATGWLLIGGVVIVGVLLLRRR